MNNRATFEAMFNALRIVREQIGTFDKFSNLDDPFSIKFCAITDALLRLTTKSFSLIHPCFGEAGPDSTEYMPFIARVIQADVEMQRIWASRNGGLSGDDMRSFAELRKSVEYCANIAANIARNANPDVVEKGMSSNAAAIPLNWPPGALVGAIVKLSCQLLPVSHRSRYLDEFRSELFDLPRRHRLAHAARLLRCALAIRAGLREQAISAQSGQDPL